MPLSPRIPRDPKEVLVSPIFPSGDSGHQVFIRTPSGKVLSCRKNGENGSRKNRKGVSKCTISLQFPSHFSPFSSIFLLSCNTFMHHVFVNFPQSPPVPQPPPPRRFPRTAAFGKQTGEETSRPPKLPDHATSHACIVTVASQMVVIQCLMVVWPCRRGSRGGEAGREIEARRQAPGASRSGA